MNALDPFLVTFKSYPVLFVVQHGVSILMSLDTRAMGCLVDIVWYDLNVTIQRVGGTPNQYCSQICRHQSLKGGLECVTVVSKA